MIEIISHCFGKKYAALLVYHLSSLVLHESKPVTMSVVYVSGDSDVTTVIKHFSEINRPWIRWNFIPMFAGLVYQRSIGRNVIARLSKADIVWFADCDYTFGIGCLDSLYPFPSDTGVYWPEIVHCIKRGRCVEMLSAVQDDEQIIPNVIDIDMSHFKPVPMLRAVGGAQIVSGDTARSLGYLSDSEEWQRPIEKYDRDDGTAYWREQFKIQKSLPISNVFRNDHV